MLSDYSGINCLNFIYGRLLSCQDDVNRYRPAHHYHHCDSNNLRGKVGFHCYFAVVPGSNIDGHCRTILGDGNL